MQKRVGDKILELFITLRSLVQDFCNWEQGSGKSLMLAVFAKLTQIRESGVVCLLRHCVPGPKGWPDLPESPPHVMPFLKNVIVGPLCSPWPVGFSSPISVEFSSSVNCCYFFFPNPSLKPPLLIFKYPFLSVVLSSKNQKFIIQYFFFRGVF